MCFLCIVGGYATEEISCEHILLSCSGYSFIQCSFKITKNKKEKQLCTWYENGMCLVQQDEESCQEYF